MPMSQIFRVALVLGVLAATPAHAASQKLLKISFSSSIMNSPATSSLFANFAANDPSASTDNAVLKAVVPVQAGNCQTFKDVLIDTGSAILWVGGENAYEPGANTRALNQTFSIGYGTGGASGIAYLDKVTIGAATVNSQIIGSANETTAFTLVRPIDGILGLGPHGSNYGEVSGFNTTPTFVENLASEGTIDEAMFGIYVNGLDASDGTEIGQGEITFGGIDESKIRGEMVWLPQNEPYNYRWSFNVSSLSFGNLSLVNDTEPGRTDTGVLGLGIP
ncbi:hypothetical protein EW146_g8798, partial [Bondarzewia mesenterica]